MTVKSASCDNGANVFQYKFNNTDNDSWLIEPVSYYNSSYGVDYAYANYNANNNSHISTYPFLEVGDCANFVSQCLCAAGKHYDGNWYINKKNNTYLSPYAGNGSEEEKVAKLNYTWQLSSPSPWISAVTFEDYWTNKVQTQTYTLDKVINNTVSSSPYKVGDVVQILKKTNYSFPISLVKKEYEATHTMYITKNPSLSKIGYFGLTYHSTNTKNRLLRDICIDYKNGSNVEHKIKFFKM